MLTSSFFPHKRGKCCQCDTVCRGLRQEAWNIVGCMHTPSVGVIHVRLEAWDSVHCKPIPRTNVHLVCVAQ